MSAAQNANTYLKTQIGTASREQLLLMLYDGAIRFSEQGKALLGEKDLEGAHGVFVRAQNIVLELLYSLNREETGGQEIVNNLTALYTYIYTRLVEANIYKDTARIDEAVRLLRSLRDAWAEAVDNLRKDGVKGTVGVPGDIKGGGLSLQG